MFLLENLWADFYESYAIVDNPKFQFTTADNYNMVNMWDINDTSNLY